MELKNTTDQSARKDTIGSRHVAGSIWDRMRATANAEQCFALVEELRISGKHVLDDNFVCAKLDKLRILGGDDFVQMGMWYVNSTRHALVKAQSV